MNLYRGGLPERASNLSDIIAEIASLVTQKKEILRCKTDVFTA